MKLFIIFLSLFITCISYAATEVNLKVDGFYFYEHPKYTQYLRECINTYRTQGWDLGRNIECAKQKLRINSTSIEEVPNTEILETYIKPLNELSKEEYCSWLKNGNRDEIKKETGYTPEMKFTLNKCYQFEEGSTKKSSPKIKESIDKPFEKISTCEGKKDSCYGQYVFLNGDRYIGNFKNGKQSGIGTYYYFDGSIYVGEFKDDKRSGSGTLFNPNGTINQQGLWREDEFVQTQSPPVTPKPPVNNAQDIKRQKCIRLGLTPGSVDFQQCMN
jgi:hypothetical protein